MQYVLILLGLMFVNVANAMDCQNMPSCESLGYSNQNDPHCAPDGYMYCPFDQNYKVCVQYDCAKMGFTESDKTSWCADLIKCKGNEKMTLCQKPCVATNYEELKDLASSGKCKVVTMRNDIIIPENQSISFADNISLDGGNHLLTATGSQNNYNLFVLRGHNTVRNLSVAYTSKQNKSYNAIFSAQDIDLENINIDFTVNSPDTNNDKAAWIVNGNHHNVVLRGKINVSINTEHYVDFIKESSLTFDHADVSIISTGRNLGGEMFQHIQKFKLQNSHLSVVAILFMSAPQAPYELENSTVEISGVLYWAGEVEKTFDLSLKSSTLTFLSDRLLSGNARNAIFRLQGTADNPSKLVFKKSLDFKQAKVETSNTTDLVEINGITYRPKQASITLLSDIETSTNWEKQ